MDESEGAAASLEQPRPELEWPPLSRITESRILLPLVIYFVLWRLAAIFVQNFLFQSYKGFRAYRLHNLSICLLHSTISGLWSLTFGLFNSDIMLNHIIHWHRIWAEQLPIISIAYFLNDSIDMARHEISRWTIELFIHHTATVGVFFFSLLPQKFLAYNYWALLMEVNSIFLHIRSIMQISGENIECPKLYTLVKILNITTFIVFRFGVQFWQIQWALAHLNLFHGCYTFIALGGGSMFLSINVFLFYRVLASDGLLGDRLAKTAAINRDQQADCKSAATIRSEKKHSE